MRLCLIMAMSPLWAMVGVMVPHAAAQPAGVPTGPLAKVRPLVAQAQAAASAWQKDAALVGIFIQARPDGLVDPKDILSPTRPCGGQLALRFYSASAGQTLHMHLDASGGIATDMSMPAVAGEQLVSIPSGFLDLDEAIAKARQSGLARPAPGTKGLLDARLVGVASEVGGPNRCTWTITAMDLSGAYPVPGEPVVLDGGSGEQTTADKLSGRAERQRLAEELTQGTQLPAGTPRAYAVYRREADALAARWSKTLRLHRMDLAYERVGQEPRISSAEFWYFEADPPAGAADSPTMLTVTLFPTAGDRVVLRVDQLEREAVHGFHVEPVPDNALTPEQAIRKLEARSQTLETDRLYLQLAHGRNLPECLGDRSGLFSRALSGLEFTAPELAEVRDQWIWRSTEKRTEQVRTGTFVYDRPYSALIYVAALECPPGDNKSLTSDSTTRDKPGGAKPVPAAATPDRPDSSTQPASPTATVDPNCVGVWEAVVSSPAGEQRWFLRIDARGTYELRADGPGAPPGHRGTFESAGGYWFLRSTTTEWSDEGSYSFQDRHTMPMTGKLGTSRWRRASSSTASSPVGR